jgi:hypothetical protein
MSESFDDFARKYEEEKNNRTMLAEGAAPQ